MSLLYKVSFFILLIINGYQSIPIPKAPSLSSPPITAMNFMKRYGYLAGGTADSEALYKESAVMDAIRELQKFGNIPITGNLDNATLKLMESPRCGVPDIIRRNDSRKKRYIIGSEGWKKRDITYFIANWTPKLEEEPIIDEMERAFDTWSGYSRLNFRQVKNPNADIIVAFGRGPHGDDYPFDGPGNILAHAYFPYEMGGYGGDIHFDDDENWAIHPSDPENGETDFFTVAVHELGHSLGLSHSPVPSSIMFPYYKGYSASFQLGYDDILAVYQLYISQPLIESETTERMNFNETEQSTTLSSTTISQEEEDKDNRDEEIVHVNSSTSTTEETLTVTFVGDWETVDHHRTHEEDNLNAIADSVTEIPNICDGSYDSISIFRTELFIFKGQYVWRFSTRGNIKKGYPVKFHTLFHGMPENITHIDASYQRDTDDSMIFFSGKSYWVYDGNKLIENSPQPISNYGILGDVEKIDAAQVWRKNGKTYLYSGDQFWRFNDENRILDSGYPKNIERWRGVPHDLDAAMTWTDGSTYFFKDNSFWRFDNTLIKTEDQYPQRVSEYWYSCE